MPLHHDDACTVVFDGMMTERGLESFAHALHRCLHPVFDRAEYIIEDVRSEQLIKGALWTLEQPWGSPQVQHLLTTAQAAGLSMVWAVRPQGDALRGVDAFWWAGEHVPLSLACLRTGTVLQPWWEMHPSQGTPPTLAQKWIPTIGCINSSASLTLGTAHKVARSIATRREQASVRGLV